MADCIYKCVATVANKVKYFCFVGVPAVESLLKMKGFLFFLLI